MSSETKGTEPQAWFVVEETSQHDDNGNGPTFLAISIHEDDATDAIAWVGNGEATDADWENARLIAEAGTVLHETGMGPRELAERIQFLKSKGLTVGMATESGKEPYLAYVIEPGSELCDLATVNNLIDAESERDRLAERVKALEHERDLAIAHDRQPYPTADAYERRAKS